MGCSMFAGVYSDHSCGVIGDYGEMLHQCPKNSCCDFEKAKSDPYMVENDKECCTQEVIGNESDPDCCSCAICAQFGSNPKLHQGPNTELVVGVIVIILAVEL